MSDRGKEISPGLVLTAALGLGLAVYLVNRRVVRPVQWLRTRFVLRSRDIVLVNTKQELRAAVQQIIRECKDHRYVGFDCEWVPQRVKGSKHHPVALLQLATPKGTCALFRLCRIGFLPEEIKAVLRDSTLLKVGVGPLEDARLLLRDFGASVHGCLDLRFLHQSRHSRPAEGTPHGYIESGNGLGLARMTQQVLGIELDKNWRIRCSNWEATTLTQRQIEYAANDALVSALMFAKFSDLERTTWTPWRSHKSEVTWAQVLQRWAHFVDVRPKHRPSDLAPTKERRLLRVQSRPMKDITRALTARSKPLYDNCFMQAPDGEVLCTCEKKKALWYVSKGLADVVPSDDDSVIVRLKFEPSSRTGEASKYYTLLKDNACVVCGGDNSYIRKHVVPHEYRKFFPSEQKEHHSHDVLLLCLRCSQLANNSELTLRHQLATKCDAPFAEREYAKSYLNPQLNQVRSAARALLNTTHTLPATRATQLICHVAAHFSVNPDNVTPQLLEEATKVNVIVENSTYVSHGQKVVEHYQKYEGIFELEKLWRSHFVTVMRPKFLPQLWSVDYKSV